MCHQLLINLSCDTLNHIKVSDLLSVIYLVLVYQQWSNQKAILFSNWRQNEKEHDVYFITKLFGLSH